MYGFLFFTASIMTSVLLLLNTVFIEYICIHLCTIHLGLLSAVWAVWVYVGLELFGFCDLNHIFMYDLKKWNLQEKTVFIMMEETTLVYQKDKKKGKKTKTAEVKVNHSVYIKECCNWMLLCTC